MAMPLAVPRYTLADLDSFPDDGNRYELVDGMLLVTPAPLPPHDVVVSRLVNTLNLFFGPSGKATVLTRGAVEVAPDVHMEPDILVIPLVAATVPANWLEVRDRWLAVEVSGRGSRIYDRDIKRPAYLNAGVREVWRADLKERCLFVATPDQPDERRHDDRLVWQPAGMAEKMIVDVNAVFEGIRGDG
jgi:Uma2 family endonuclease